LGEVFQVNSSTILAFESNFHPFGMPMPIRLEKEWFLKLGLSCQNDEYVLIIDEFLTIKAKSRIRFDVSVFTVSIIVTEENGDLNIDLAEFKTKRCIPHIRYVHQFQNMVYYLTDTELTAKI